MVRIFPKFRMAQVALLLAFIGCGKEGPVITPEKVSPIAVEIKEIKGLASGVAFTWQAPDQEVRGKPLQELYGYRVYRKQLESSLDVLDTDEDFERLETLSDNTIETLRDRKEAAREEGKILRKIKLSDDEKKVSFLDKNVHQGGIYLYKITAYNHPLVEGPSSRYARVKFQGEASEISFVDAPKDDIDETDPTLELATATEDQRFQSGL